jgi:hypothetical protein
MKISIVGATDQLLTGGAGAVFLNGIAHHIDINHDVNGLFQINFEIDLDMLYPKAKIVEVHEPQQLAGSVRPVKKAGRAVETRPRAPRRWGTVTSRDAHALDRITIESLRELLRRPGIKVADISNELGMSTSKLYSVLKQPNSVKFTFAHKTHVCEWINRMT